MNPNQHHQQETQWNKNNNLKLLYSYQSGLYVTNVNSNKQKMSHIFPSSISPSTINTPAPWENFNSWVMTKLTAEIIFLLKNKIEHDQFSRVKGSMIQSSRSLHKFPTKNLLFSHFSLTLDSLYFFVIIFPFNLVCRHLD